MNQRLDRKIRDRAGHRCEYCRLPQSPYPFRFPIDHIIAEQHRGKTRSSNLALACLRCNRHKGPNVAGIDPVSNKLVRLFHPRRDRWARHFRWRGPRLVGRTSVGRATIVVLALNHQEAVAVRKALVDEGIFPAE